MNAQQDQLDALRDIRNLMERSSRYLPLSGIAGIIIGVLSMAGVAWLYFFLDLDVSQVPYYERFVDENGVADTGYTRVFLLLFGAVFFISLAVEIGMAERNAKKKKVPAWDAIAQRFLVNLGIPLIAGGVYALVLASQGQYQLMLPATLIFYGLALVNASRYTIGDIRFLGFAELFIGLLASYYPTQGLLLWALGFGVFHILYGILIYFKHEK